MRTICSCYLIFMFLLIIITIILSLTKRPLSNILVVYYFSIGFSSCLGLLTLGVFFVIWPSEQVVWNICEFVLWHLSKTLLSFAIEKLKRRGVPVLRSKKAKQD